jgi:hypothetical protein
MPYHDIIVIAHKDETIFGFASEDAQLSLFLLGWPQD